MSTTANGETFLHVAPGEAHAVPSPPRPAAGAVSEAASSGVAQGLQALVPVLTSIVTGAAILGFAALVGGVVEWVRANEAGLPPAEAVSLMSKATLLANGAELLVPAVLVAILAVAALWMADHVVCRRNRRRLEPAIKAAQAQVDEQHQIEEAARTALDRADVRHERARQDFLRAFEAREDYSRTQRAVQEAFTACDKARDDVQSAERASYAAERELDSIHRTVTAADKGVRAVVLGVLLVVFEAGILLWLGSVSAAHLVILLVLLILSGAFALVIYDDFGFVWLGVATLVAVGTFYGTAQSFALRDHPKVEPAAALMDNVAPIEGIYVTQTSDRVYLGTPDGSGYSLIGLPRDKVRSLSVGNLVPLGNAPDDSSRLASSLCDVLKAQPPGANAPRC